MFIRYISKIHTPTYTKWKH